MKKVWAVRRTVRGDAGCMTVICKTFDSEPEAKKFAEGLQSDIQKLLGAQLVFVAPDGSASMSGLVLRNFLRSLGMEQVGHVALELDVHVADLEEAKPPGIILAS